jgi:ketosteroid isomerase-like protein
VDEDHDLSIAETRAGRPVDRGRSPAEDDDMEEERNLRAVETWARLYNDEPHRMVDESYAEEFEVHVMGQMVMRKRDTFHRAEQGVLDVAPRRRARIERTIAAGDTVVVEAVLIDPDRGEDWQTPWCAVLRFRDGKIVSDHTYLDAAKWPGFRAPASKR